ncbi:MAG: hypothetical protein PF689_06495 [Deltaproteobacteria bacterium]|nr:hypothetical protein [Deltaproteobacteria bacterium]
MKKIFVIVFVIVIGFTQWSSLASATTILETFGDHNSINPLGNKIFSSGAGAVYSNPSLLLNQKKSFTIGIVNYYNGLNISYLPKGSQYNVPESIFDSIPINNQNPVYRPLPTSLLRNKRGSNKNEVYSQYLSLGTVIPFAKGNVVFGFQAVLPLKAFQVQSPFYVDEREQYFSNSLHYELFEDRMQASVISFALAGKMNSWLHVGAGLTMSQTAMTTTELYMPDASEQEVSYLNSNIEITTSFIPHFAAALILSKQALLTATVHLSGESRTEGVSDIQFYNYQNQEGDEKTLQKFTMVYGWQPLRAALAGSYKFGSKGSSLTLGGTLMYYKWSDYVDRHGEKPVNPWQDTFSAVLSVQCEMGETNLGFDAQFVPTPVPVQEGRSNYVDNNRLAFSLGVSHPFTWHGLEMAAGISAQFHYMLSRSHAKNPDDPNPVIDEFVDSKNIFSDEYMPESGGFQTNNPGYPGFSSEGWMTLFSLWLKIAL